MNKLVSERARLAPSAAPVFLFPSQVSPSSSWRSLRCLCALELSLGLFAWIDRYVEVFRKFLDNGMHGLNVVVAKQI